MNSVFKIFCSHTNNVYASYAHSWAYLSSCITCLWQEVEPDPDLPQNWLIHIIFQTLFYVSFWPLIFMIACISGQDWRSASRVNSTMDYFGANHPCLVMRVLAMKMVLETICSNYFIMFNLYSDFWFYYLQSRCKYPTWQLYRICWCSVRSGSGRGFLVGCGCSISVTIPWPCSFYLSWYFY